MRRCQQLRKGDWEKAKLEADDGYRDQRNKDKAEWRQAHSKEDAAYRRRRRADRRATRTEPKASGPAHNQTPSPSNPDRGVGIGLGRYVMQPLDVPGFAPNVVEVVVISIYPPDSIEQIVSASETDAFARRTSASRAADGIEP